MTHITQIYICIYTHSVAECKYDDVNANPPNLRDVNKYFLSHA